MKPLVIVKREVRSQVVHRICHALVIFDVHLLIFHTPPEALYKNVIERPSSAIPADANSGSLEPINKLSTGKLHALIVVEDLGRGDL